ELVGEVRLEALIRFGQAGNVCNQDRNVLALAAEVGVAAEGVRGQRANARAERTALHLRTAGRHTPPRRRCGRPRKPIARLRSERQRLGQALSCPALGLPEATLEMLDGPCAQPGTVGQRLLGQASS